MTEVLSAFWDYKGYIVSYGHGASLKFLINTALALQLYSVRASTIYFSDLVSGTTYTVSVSTVNDLSDQVEAAGQFDSIASSLQVTVPGGPSDNTTIAIIGVSITVVILFITTAAMIVIFLFAIR